MTESVDRSVNRVGYQITRTDGRTDGLTEKNLRCEEILQLSYAHARIPNFIEGEQQ